MIGIVILNWNGWEDTCQCINSLLNTDNYQDLAICVVDNGSTNNSVLKIKEYLTSINKEFSIAHEGETNAISFNEKLIIYQLNKNYGFAKGNNLALEFLQLRTQFNYEYFFILNNDTEVKKDSISLLKSFMDHNKKYTAATPQIRYYGNKDKIWNCGGILKWGFRKYYYANKSYKKIKREIHDISFVTGCALFISPKLIYNHKLFTERFFFGEEDFDFSLRMKKSKNLMACINKSIIYHKVSASSASFQNINKIHVHYLNRYINLRLHMHPLNYACWKVVNNFYILLLLSRSFSVKQSFLLIKEINKESKELEGVTYPKFLNILQS